MLLRALLNSIALEAQTGQLVLQLQLLLRDPIQVQGQLRLRLLGHVQLHANAIDFQVDFRAVLRFITNAKCWSVRRLKAVPTPPYGIFNIIISGRRGLGI